VRKGDLDKELDEAIEWERDMFHRRISRLLEDLEDELGFSETEYPRPG